MFYKIETMKRVTYCRFYSKTILEIQCVQMDQIMDKEQNLKQKLAEVIYF